jgi:cyclic beta-1,2-glucan synthetase
MRWGKKMFTSATEGFKQFIPSPTFIFALVFIISIVFLVFLYYIFIHVRKRITSPTETMKAKEVLGPRELEQQMFILSYTHKNVKWNKCNFVIGHRNQVSYKSLNKIRNTLSEIPSEIIVLIPAARWLFDNFHMMYRELKKVNITETNRKPLPILQEGECKGNPRIYVVARKMVALSGGYLNEDNISLMVKAYQKELPLAAAELWVLPEMIGLCLLEDIIVVAEDIIHIAETKSKARAFVKKSVKEQEDTGSISIFLKELDEDFAAKTSFHSHVIYLLKNMSFDEASIQRYVEYYYKFDDNYSKPSDIFLDEGKIESCLESSIRVLLTSLRETYEIDTEKLFENLSLLEHMLLKDPDGVYPEMDSESRSRYRSVIEKLALKHHINEIFIAENCLELAGIGREDLKCSHHVGAYLVGRGYPILKAKVLNKLAPKSLKPKGNLKGLLYFLSISLMVFISYFLLGQVLQETSLESGIYAGLTFLVISLCLIMGIAIDLTNNIFTKLIPVRELPSLDFLKGIPDRARTYVVMPVIITSEEQGLEYINRLHRHYLANRQDNLFFALLVDFEDSARRCMAKDEKLENVFSDRINQLNALYPLFTYRRFSLFVRSRQWNESEKCYMGWERKRGKIEEFNALLSGEKDTSFSMILCDEGLLSTFKYVITLDADSSLIKNNAAKLVGIMEHPLNQPVLDPMGKKIIEGYGIIQPSVTNHISSKKSSLFYRVFAGKQGLDRYSTVISDIYHDVFDEGIFVGKGIYHIKAFHNILNKTIHENSILSHDLLESCYVKTAFSSTVKIMDDHPNCLLSYAKREHRWIRGDWQLLPWLFKNKALTGLSRWKILDNFRRSLVSLCRVFLILLNLALIPEMYYLWLPLIFFTDVVNLSLLLYNTITHKIKRPKLALVYKDLLKDIRLLIQRALLDIIFAPYMAYIATDAVLRTLYRLFKSKKNLLMWNTSETIEKCKINTKLGYFLHMWSSLIPSVFIIGLLLVVDIQLIGMVIFGVLSVVWGLSFLIAYEISQPRNKSENEELKDNKKRLREIARGTWQFFEDFSTRDNNWLCPDNYQKEPVEKVTDKTSPTNIGLQLLAVLSARDLGYETLNATLKNVENILYSVAVLPKWKGHLFNWYNIKNLQVLNPQYISTVDSGNFFGHLITLKNGLVELIDAPLFSPELVSGLQDTLILCKKEIILKEEYKTVGDFIEEITAIRDNMNSQEKKPEEKTLFVGELNRSINLIIKEAAELKIDDSSFSSGPTLKQLALKDNLYAKDLMERIEGISNTIDIMFENVDFGALYNEKRMLFHIGYHLSSQRLDTGCYDLIASECSLTSFLAIAKEDVPVKHWYRLGRPLTIIKGIPCFVSWSGTMFEYLMPNLVMREYEGSVFAETSRAAVLKHIDYAKGLGIPWGISESQHYHFDLDSNYQYKAFGVPELRLEASLSLSTLVVAPYATILALGYAEEDCFSNLKKMAELGCVGDYGYYEAIDFTGPDPVAMTPYSIVKSFMAHHQGMNLVAINNFLHNRIMQRRFHSEPVIQATEVLLEEKQNSHFISISQKGYNIQFKKMEIPEEIHSNRYVNKIAPELPVAHFLSINNYSMMITSDGDGFSDYRGMRLYRWRSDLYASTGNHIFIKDVEGNKFWSSAYNPTKTEPDKYQVVFWPHQAEFKRRDGDVSTDTIVSLSPNHNLEIRKVTLTNHSKEKKQIELTSYMEVVVDGFSAEISHPAFNKLFIESWFIDDHHIFLSKRRSSKDSHKPYLMHMVKSSIKPLKSIEYENDRLKFMGRNNTVQNPDAVVHSLPLSNSADFSKDPIISLRVSIDLEAASTASIYFITGVCADKEEAVRIGEELSDVVRIEHLNQKFRLQSDLELKYINITRAQLNAFQDLISPIFYPSRYYRGPSENIRRNWKNQSFLWRFGVSGDNPILLLRVISIEQAGIIRDVIKAYEYLRINKVKVDLIVLSEAKYGYMQELNDLLNDMTTSLKVFDESREKPSMFILHSYQMTPADVDLLLSVARVVFTEKTGIYFKNAKESF